METLQTIQTRRSIKKYTSERISVNKIEAILKAAMYAPSARNYQPWHFIVLEERRDIDQISKINTHAEMMLQAPLAIIICGDTKLETNIENLVMGCSAATQNALLAIHELGLGGIWVSIYPMKDIVDEVKKFYGLPENILPISAIAIGVPNEIKESEDRFHKEKIHYHRW